MPRRRSCAPTGPPRANHPFADGNTDGRHPGAGRGDSGRTKCDTHGVANAASNRNTDTLTNDNPDALTNANPRSDRHCIALADPDTRTEHHASARRTDDAPPDSGARTAQTLS